MRTQVAIIGAGPAGLMLSHLLHLQGIESVVLETRSRQAVESTIRAGVLEQGTVDLLNQTGLGERMRREGVQHQGIRLAFCGQQHRIDLAELTDRAITVYAQHEVLKDMIAARQAAQAQLYFEVEQVSLQALDSERPQVHYRHAGEQRQLNCDFVIGCDGFHGISRAAMPGGLRQDYTRIYPFGWFGILVEAPPSSDELIYARHARGFALISTRSAGVQRMYFQCDPAENVDQWSDDRIWNELETRLENHDGWSLKKGRIFQKNVVGMRSFVTEPMRCKRLLLAGDAAHIVPPTGAKGLNLAMADVCLLSQALEAFYLRKSWRRLDSYSDDALKRVWRAEHFSWWMTNMLHTHPDGSPFQQRLQLSELQYTVKSRSAMTVLAENYVGSPFQMN
ncbi:MULTISPECIES: 4-hydroxybenzoate 3-monooxygenase [unclassified Serratia (in: enterobacteria)]|uniref:4-hydroxybenzoate 3-monooxygenase n=1 Tax=unclassified Serratia (in: enterobacteria) TaxID=2647522 RepID=UPI002ED58182|nr:4-hydroxybenzoate 3-monooxygenase [Serratia sp. C2(2)]MEE4446464.1 4-hydroxybenzoate 3-monooxygenase [Serratia sp. C2(1)]